MFVKGVDLCGALLAPEQTAYDLHPIDDPEKDAAAFPLEIEGQVAGPAWQIVGHAALGVGCRIEGEQVTLCGKKGLLFHFDERVGASALGDRRASTNVAVQLPARFFKDVEYFHGAAPVFAVVGEPLGCDAVEGVGGRLQHDVQFSVMHRIGHIPVHDLVDRIEGVILHQLGLGRREERAQTYAQFVRRL